MEKAMQPHVFKLPIISSPIVWHNTNNTYIIGSNGTGNYCKVGNINYMLGITLATW